MSLFDGQPFVAACRPWPGAAPEVVRPRALVLLGATAARARLGAQARIGRERGRPQGSSLAGAGRWIADRRSGGE